jgi:hypothetical protein
MGTAIPQPYGRRGYVLAVHAELGSGVEQVEQRVFPGHP